MVCLHARPLDTDTNSNQCCISVRTLQVNELEHGRCSALGVVDDHTSTRSETASVSLNTPLDFATGASHRLQHIQMSGDEHAAPATLLHQQQQLQAAPALRVESPSVHPSAPTHLYAPVPKAQVRAHGVTRVGMRTTTTWELADGFIRSNESLTVEDSECSPSAGGYGDHAGAIASANAPSPPYAYGRVAQPGVGGYTAPGIHHPEDVGKDMSRMQCRHCGQYGHIMRYCSMLTCFHCGSAGHMASVCPVATHERGTVGRSSRHQVQPPMPPQYGRQTATTHGGVTSRCSGSGYTSGQAYQAGRLQPTLRHTHTGSQLPLPPFSGYMPSSYTTEQNHWQSQYQDLSPTEGDDVEALHYRTGGVARDERLWVEPSSSPHQHASKHQSFTQYQPFAQHQAFETSAWEHEERNNWNTSHPHGEAHSHTSGGSPGLQPLTPYSSLSMLPVHSALLQATGTSQMAIFTSVSPTTAAGSELALTPTPTPAC